MELAFSIGDWVETEFSGIIEGVNVTVKKRLVVTGCYIKQENHDWNPQVLYICHEKWPTSERNAGKEYRLFTGQLGRVEPLINEMLKVQEQQKP